VQVVHQLFSSGSRNKIWTRKIPNPTWKNIPQYQINSFDPSHLHWVARATKR